MSVEEAFANENTNLKKNSTMVFCCGPEFLFWEEGYQIGSYGNESSSCKCNSGFVSIGFNPFVDKCDQGAVICSGFLPIFKPMWLLVLIGLVILLGLRAWAWTVDKQSSIMMDCLKAGGDVILLAVAVTNIMGDYTFDLAENKIGYLLLGHWIVSSLFFYRLVLLKNFRYLESKAIFSQGRKARKKQALLTQTQRAVVDMIVCYLMITWSAWVRIFFNDAVHVANLVRPAQLVNLIQYMYLFGTNLVAMRSLKGDLDYLANDLTTEGPVLDRVHKAQLMAATHIRNFKLVLVLVPPSQIFLFIGFQVLRETNYLMLLFFFPLGMLSQYRLVLTRIRNHSNFAKTLPSVGGGNSASGLGNTVTSKNSKP